ncbi:hypothetical protein X975_19336, partial [Stegodyphus mimosarum]
MFCCKATTVMFVVLTASLLLQSNTDALCFQSFCEYYPSLQSFCCDMLSIQDCCNTSEKQTDDTNCIKVQSP